MTEPQITRLTEATPDSLSAVNRLLPQLSTHAQPLTLEELQAIADHSCLFLLVADGNVAGMLTLTSYRCPTGRKWWVEDVVVDRAWRGRGLGRLLLEHAMAYARQAGRGTLMLTSRPSRSEANALYRALGFQPKETNGYTYYI